MARPQRQLNLCCRSALRSVPGLVKGTEHAPCGVPNNALDVSFEIVQASVPGCAVLVCQLRVWVETSPCRVAWWLSPGVPGGGFRSNTGKSEIAQGSNRCAVAAAARQFRNAPHGSCAPVHISAPSRAAWIGAVRQKQACGARPLWQGPTLGPSRACLRRRWQSW